MPGMVHAGWLLVATCRTGEPPNPDLILKLVSETGEAVVQDSMFSTGGLDNGQGRYDSSLDAACRAC